MSLRLNPNLRPPGGYEYTDVDGVRHLGTDLATLVASLTRYRKTTGRPTGNPEDEITAAICARSPRFCTGGVAPAKLSNDTKKALAIYVANDIRRAALHPLESALIVDEAEARRRAAVCLNCPGRVTWKEGCLPCQVSVVGMVEKVLGNNPVIPGTEDRACAGAGDSLTLAVWRQTPRSITQLPPDIACWRKERSK